MWFYPGVPSSPLVFWWNFLEIPCLRVPACRTVLKWLSTRKVYFHRPGEIALIFFILVDVCMYCTNTSTYFMYISKGVGPLHNFEIPHKIKLCFDYQVAVPYETMETITTKGPISSVTEISSVTRQQLSKIYININTWQIFLVISRIARSIPLFSMEKLLVYIKTGVLIRSKLSVIGANLTRLPKKFCPFRFQQAHLSNYPTINTSRWRDDRKEIALIFLRIFATLFWYEEQKTVIELTRSLKLTGTHLCSG